MPLDFTANEKAPRKLVTTGLGGVFPAGIPIGSIVHLEPSADGLFKTGTVVLDPRINELSEVTVMIPLTNE